MHVLFCRSLNFSKIDYILENKASFNKFKKIEISFCILSDHNGRKLEANNKRNYRKYSNIWRMNMAEEIRENIKKFLESNENETQPTRRCETQQRPC
jgi:hypothetical protein